MKKLLVLVVGLVAIHSQAAEVFVKEAQVTSHITEGVKVSQLVGRQLDDYAAVENVSQFVIRSKSEVTLNDIADALTHKMGSEAGRSISKFCKYALKTKDVKSCVAQLVADPSLSVKDTSELFFEAYLGDDMDNTEHMLAEELDADYNVERAMQSLTALESFIVNVKAKTTHVFVVDMAKIPNVDYSMAVAIKISSDKKSVLVTLVIANCGS